MQENYVLFWKLIIYPRASKCFLYLSVEQQVFTVKLKDQLSGLKKKAKKKAYNQVNGYRPSLLRSS